MDVLEYMPIRDLDLYVKGDLEAFRQSFPGLSVPGPLRSPMIQELKALETTEYCAAYTAVLDEEPIGFVIVEMRAFYSIPQGYVSSIYVDKKHRRMGVSSQLLERAERWAKSKGAYSLTLDVSLVNEKALSAYEASGYTETRVQMEKII